MEYSRQSDDQTQTTTRRVDLSKYVAMSFTVRLDAVAATKTQQQDHQAEDENRNHEEKLEFAVRCRFPDKFASKLASWNGVSRPWRNVFAWTPENEAFTSKRFWFSEVARLQKIDEESLTALANTEGLCIEAFAGRKVEDEAEALATTRVSILDLLQGRRLDRTIELCIADETRISAQLSIVPDAEFINYAVCGRVLTLEDCTLACMPQQFVQDWIDNVCPPSESPDPQFTEEQAEALASLANEESRKVVIEICLADASVDKVDDENDAIEAVKSEAESESEETTDPAAHETPAEVNDNEDNKAQGESEEETDDAIDVDTKREPCKFVLSSRQIVFDKQSLSWQLAQTEETPIQVPRLFIALGTIAQLGALDAIWKTCAVTAKVESPDNAAAAAEDAEIDEDSKQQTSEAFVVNLQALLEPGVPALATSTDDGAVLIRISTSRPLIRAPGVGRDVVSISSLAPTASSDRVARSGVSLRACEAVKSVNLYLTNPQTLSKTNATSTIRKEADAKDVLRMRLLSSIQEAAGLRTRADEETLRQTMDLVTQLQNSGNGERMSAERLRYIAQEAELVGQLARACEMWCELATQRDASANYDFALCMARQGKLGQAIELLLRLPQELESGEPLDVESLLCQAQEKKSSKYRLLSAPLLLAFLRFELGDKDALFFPASPLPEATQADTASQAAQSEQSASPEIYLRLAESLADLDLALSTQKVLMCAHLRAQNPLEGEFLVRSEMVRAKHKMMTGAALIGAEILQRACRRIDAGDQEVSEIVRAKAHHLLGLALAKVQEATKSRSAHSSAMSILNELEERGLKPIDKRWAPELSSLRLHISFCLGTLTSAIGDWRKARVVYRNAVRAPAALGTLGWAWQGLGRACTQLGDMREADLALRKALIADPGNPKTWGFFAAKHTSAGPAAVDCEIQHTITIALRRGLCEEELLQQLNSDARIADRLHTVIPHARA
ncbi:Hypothetical Protein FCC1311_062212 [Hondaea fermentalgiana]|uniref:Uncharacterized protein n=1 Tax=Hondaea fermentalgiana TaxID=2315210 RepID=A0A2R5GNX1_9STRA|nr:Hypothetical Protein FCC1311_062212 [Hondaea fermentalgiana]|eukprot:GBG30001.1 Hypothetical Protein FCC1311_062212 [Hondaea fermentalgiana]